MCRGRLKGGPLGRVPWLDEPACRDCHTAQYGEPVGVLYRHAAGHGGVLCVACHNSPHAIWPGRGDRDNASAIAVQGHAGTLSDCAVCHGHTPAEPGPHGYVPTGVVEAEIMGGAAHLVVHPNPVRLGQRASVRVTDADPGGGRMLVFDARGRTVRMLEVGTDGAGTVQASWDGTNQRGEPVATDVYFLRWQTGERKAVGKLVLIN